LHAADAPVFAATAASTTTTKAKKLYLLYARWHNEGSARQKTFTVPSHDLDLLLPNKPIGPVTRDPPLPVICSKRKVAHGPVDLR
jgi:hypothetical protein